MWILGERLSLRRPRPSIHAHILAHLEDEGLREEGLLLPDDEEVAGDSGLQYAAGAFERLIDIEEEEDADVVVARLHAALVELADRPGRRNRAHALATLRSEPPRQYVDRVLERLEAFPPSSLDRLYTEVRKVAVDSGRRDEVKYALAVLGIYCREEDIDLLRTFARHDEFTLYAAIALGTAVPDPIEEWLQLCRHVNGWGRIELVHLLLREPREDVCRYLLRDGFRNHIDYGETALEVAAACDLAGTLEREHDPELVAAARDLLSSLAKTWGEPGRMLDYDDGIRATLRFLDLFEPQELADYLALQSIRGFVDDDAVHGEPGGWPLEIRSDARACCRALLDDPLWRDVVEAELRKDFDELPGEVVLAAKHLGVPLRAFLTRHVQQHPEDPGTWYYLLDDADTETMDAALALAVELYDFGELAEGPGDEMFRPEPVFQAAGWFLQALRKHPGRGWDVIRPALRSPLFRNRRDALWALSRWPRRLLTESHVAAIGKAARDDPSEGIRRGAGMILRSEPVEADDFVDDEDLEEWEAFRDQP